MARNYHLGIRLSEAEAQRLIELAKEDKRKPSDYARKILLEYIEKE